jgi:chromate transporter
MPPSYRDLTRVFGRIGLLSFGGPAAQIALMHRELVEQRPWLTDAEYLRALSFCMLLPGPEAMQLATYCGWRLRGTPGGLIAGGLFVLPGAIFIMVLAMAYTAYGQLPLASALLLGVQAAVLAIVAQALWKLSNRALKTNLHRALAIAAFTALFVFHLPFPLVIATAAIIGYATSPKTPKRPTKPLPWPQILRPAALWSTLWLAPLAALKSLGQPFLYDIALLFSKLALLTFGGAYAVLAWLTQSMVTDNEWLTTPQMIDALGLAETTPGPLILVTQFTAYIAGYGKGGGTMGLMAALIALWMTFIPCFLWIFAGAPLIARLEHAPRLTAALAAITAAVVGVIANLSLWFALHVLIQPATYSPNVAAIALAALAAALLLGCKWGLLPTLVTCASLSLALTLI